MSFAFLLNPDEVFVYIIECSDGSYYTGITKDLDIRMKQHSNGTGSKYVRGRRPFRLVYFELQESRSRAMKREREIKKLSRMRKEQLVRAFDSKRVHIPRDLDE